MIEWVLDASAVLAMFYREPGGDQVRRLLTNSILSAVNASEVVTGLIGRGTPPEAASQMVRSLACQPIAVDTEPGLRAGELVVLTRSKGLSLGDRICLALAERENLTALTSDRAWAELRLDIKVSLIR
jgi:PIN domain nuclease of toxin-antitoxin system